MRWDLPHWCEISKCGVPLGWCEICPLMWESARARSWKSSHAHIPKAFADHALFRAAREAGREFLRPICQSQGSLDSDIVNFIYDYIWQYLHSDIFRIYIYEYQWYRAPLPPALSLDAFDVGNLFLFQGDTGVLERLLGDRSGNRLIEAPLHFPARII